MRRFGRGSPLALCLLAVATLLFAGHSTPIYGANPFSDITGEFHTRLVYSVTEGFSGLGGVKVTLPLATVRTENPRLVVGLADITARTNVDLNGSYRENIFTPSRPVSLDVTSIRYELTGPLWKAGPDVELRVGQFYVHYSDWVARSVGVRGLEIRGLTLRNHAASVYYGFPNAWTAWRVEHGARDRVVRLVGLHRPGSVAAGYVTDLHLHLRSGSLRGTHIRAEVALDGTTGAGAVEMERMQRLGRNAWVSMRLWAVDAYFDPPRARRNREGVPTAFIPGQIGLQVSAGRTVQDVAYELRLTNALAGTDVQGAVWEVEVSGETGGNSVIRLERLPSAADGGYRLELHRERADGGQLSLNLEWDQGLRAWEAIGTLPKRLGLQPIDISLLVRGQDALLQPMMRIGVEWEAPNGFHFGVYYATHDGTTLGLGPREELPAGAYVTGAVTTHF